MPNAARIRDLRLKIATVSKRIETVNSDHMWDAGQRLLDRYWREIEALVGHPISSIPNDADKPMCFARNGVVR